METISLKKAQKANKVSNKAKGTSTSTKEASTDEKNVKKIKNNIAKERDVMYQYPEGLDGLEKKKFRASQRRQLAAFQRDLKKKHKNEPEKRAKLLRKAQKWAASVYTKEHQPTFE